MDSVLVVRALALVPSLLTVLLMPGIVIQLTYVLSTEELTKAARLKEVMITQGGRERDARTHASPHASEERID